MKCREKENLQLDLFIQGKLLYGVNLDQVFKEIAVVNKYVCQGLGGDVKMKEIKE